MKQLKFVLMMVMLMFLFSSCFWLPAVIADCYTVGEETIRPGFQVWVWDVVDPCGNYQRVEPNGTTRDNRLFIKIRHNYPDGINLSVYQGLVIDANLPNPAEWLVVDNARYIPDANVVDMTGSFGIGLPFKHYGYEFNFTVRDSADNNSCGTTYFYVVDKGVPRITSVRKYQK